MKTELELFYLSAQKLVSQDTKTKNLYNFGMSVVAFDSVLEPDPARTTEMCNHLQLFQVSTKFWGIL